MEQLFRSPFDHQCPSPPSSSSSQTRQLVYRLRFGKYEGSTLAEVPMEYKEWLIRNKFHLGRPDLNNALALDGCFGDATACEIGIVDCNAKQFHGQAHRPAHQEYQLNFGKHIGKCVSELPAEYKEWLVFHKYHLRLPELYEALEADGYFHPKSKSPTPSHDDAGSQCSKRKRSDTGETQQDMPAAKASCRASDSEPDMISDEIASWCHSNSSGLDEWDEEDNFLTQFDLDQSLNAGDEDAHNLVVEQVLPTAAASEFEPATEEFIDQEDVFGSTDDIAREIAELTEGVEVPADLESAPTVSGGQEVQARLVRAFEAYEGGDCVEALRLLRSALHRVTTLRGELTEEERACVDATIVTVSHAARMIAVNFRSTATQALIEAGDADRQSGLFEIAVGKYAEVVSVGVRPRAPRFQTEGLSRFDGRWCTMFDNGVA
mmetsp:Transcript_12524/g.25799  ORF Transcript_12524/g.25799 Transcript_12524/m.25799 type:complete len:434 (+) Transcript_12524:60-1361(+)